MGDALQLNRPEVHAQVTKAFVAYDAALLANDVETLNGFFVPGPFSTRFGLGQELYGSEEIGAWRRSAPPLVRKPLHRYDIVTINEDTAVVTAQWAEDGVIGRQSQTWVRTDEGWQILCGHVSTRTGVSA